LVTSEIIALANNARDPVEQVPIEDIVKGDELNDGYRAHYRPNRTPRAFSPHMATPSARYRSFNGCHPKIRTDLVQMVQAGFFCTGTPGLVHCFSCGGGLEDWAPNKCPWTEHAKYYPECHYLRNTRGVSFVEYVQRKFTEETKYMSLMPKPHQPGRVPLTCYGCGNKAEVLMFNCFHFSACVQCIREMTMCPQCHVKIVGHLRAYIN
jgi:hypothetical protein